MLEKASGEVCGASGLKETSDLSDEDDDCDDHEEGLSSKDDGRKRISKTRLAHIHMSGCVRGYGHLAHHEVSQTAKS